MCPKTVGRALRWVERKVVNTAKDVSGVTAAENRAKREYKRKQEEADKLAKQKQAELDRLARQREATVAQQQATLKAQELRLAQQRDAQGNLVTDLQGQQADLLAGLQAESTQRIGEARARGNAVTNSLRILAQKSNKAPTAQTSQKKGRTSRPRSTTAGLRLGGGRSGSGSGTNYSV